ncbi:hypothetical protein AB1L88_13710 [Tautonia sp. JC769]|uniref:hypothetical protein n=1 Tax=Tautonia sp. JC769 TaxID=3232135 RepID=UPI003458E90A
MPDAPDRPDPASVRCPTCGAVQPWSDSCRRCRSDLRLLGAFASAYDRLRRDCLRSLRLGDARAALESARSCAALCPSAESHRMLAAASLLLGDPATAFDLARRSLAREA